MILSDRGQGSVQNCTQQKAGHAYVCVDGLSLSPSAYVPMKSPGRLYTWMTSANPCHSQKPYF